MIKYLICLALFFTVYNPTIANQEDKSKQQVPQITEEYKNTAYRLFKTFGLGSEYTSMINGIITRAKLYKPEIPNEFWDKLPSNFDETAYFDEVTKVYAEIFNLEEIKELVKFYETPLYKKLMMNSTGLMVKTGEVQDLMYSDVNKKMISIIEKNGYEVPEFMLPEQNLIEEEPVPGQNK